MHETLKSKSVCSHSGGPVDGSKGSNLSLSPKPLLTKVPGKPAIGTAGRSGLFQTYSITAICKKAGTATNARDLVTRVNI